MIDFNLEVVHFWWPYSNVYPDIRLALSSLSSSDLSCTRRGDYSSTKVSTNDHTTSGLTFALLFKYALMLLAALALPLIFFKLFILPMTILFGLKAATLLNSFLLGSLLYKYKYWKPNNYSGTSTGTTSTTNTGSSTATRPVYSGSTVTRPVATTSSTSLAGNSLALGLASKWYWSFSFYVHLIHCASSLFCSDESVDYVDIAGPGEDLSRTLKLLTKKNKNWWNPIFILF